MLNTKYQNLLTDDQAVKDLVQEILDVGYVEMEDFLDEPSKAAFHELANNDQYRNAKGEQLKGTAIHDFGYSDELLLLSQRIYDARCSITGEPRVTLTKDKQVVGMPYKDGRQGTINEETAYHFDGAYVNYLLPLILPEDQSDGSGNLVVFPNLRLKYPAMISKIVSRFLRHFAWFRKMYGETEIVYKVDTMSIVFADLTFHGVNPISNGERAVVTINSHW